MRLSLHILADWLAKYRPQASIVSGRRSIRNVRPFSDEHQVMPSNVYVSRAGDSGGVMCIHENDFLLLHTDDENQVLNDIMDALDYYNGWSDRLNQQLAELSMEELLTECSAVMGGMLLLTDASYYVLARTETPPELEEDPALRLVEQHNIMSLEQILNVEEDNRIRERRSSYLMRCDGFFEPPTVRNLFTQDRHWGWLVSVHANPTQGLMDVQDEFGELFERWMDLHRELQGKWERTGVFLEIMDGGSLDRSNLEFRLQLLGWQADDEKYVYAVALPSGHSGSQLAYVRKLDQLTQTGCAFVHRDRLLLVYNSSTGARPAFEQRLTALLQDSGCTAGRSPIFTDIFALPQHCELACAAASAAPPDAAPLRRFEDAALRYGLSQLQKHTGSWLCHPALPQLQNYDRENHTELCRTLQVYLESERSYVETAKRLFIHRNSLLYRVQRIEELTGLDLSDPSIRLHLLLSYAIQTEKGAQA